MVIVMACRPCQAGSHKVCTVVVPAGEDADGNALVVTCPCHALHVNAEHDEPAQVS